jgi:FMN-dependent NADH-azoreductase
MNFVDPYLKMILGFIGVTEATFVTTGGAAQVMTGAVDREAFLKPTLERVRSVAA